MKISADHLIAFLLIALPIAIGFHCGLFRKTKPLPGRAPTFSDGENSIIYVGHATTLIHLDGLNILTDPNFSNRVLITKRRIAPGIKIENLPRLDLILISHGHFDHLDMRSLRRLWEMGQRPPVVVAQGLAKFPRKAGFEEVRELSVWEQIEVDGLSITAVPAHHFPGRSPLNRKTTYQGYVVEGKGGTVYFAGDTGLFEGFRTIGEKFQIDVALLPIGAYSPPPFRRHHLSPEDALKAMELLGAGAMVPIHWGAFKLSLESVDEPPKRLMSAAHDRGLEDRVFLLQPGERCQIGER